MSMEDAALSMREILPLFLSCPELELSKQQLSSAALLADHQFMMNYLIEAILISVFEISQHKYSQSKKNTDSIMAKPVRRSTITHLLLIY